MIYMNNHYAWRTAVLADTDVSPEHKVGIQIVGDNIDWHDAYKEFRSHRHFNGWLGYLCDRYNTDEGDLIASIVTGVKAGYFEVESETEVEDIEQTLYRTMPGDSGE